MNRVNLCKEFDVTQEELDNFIDFLYAGNTIGSWYGDFKVCVAVTKLLCHGDIEENED